MASFKELPLSELRARLPKFKRQVQLGLKRIAATYYSQVVGFLVPLKDIEGFENEGWIDKSKTEEMSLTDFRAQMTECWENLQVEIDCIYLTYHSRRIAAFVSPRLMPYLDIEIPDSEIATKLLALDSGIIEVESLMK